MAEQEKQNQPTGEQTERVSETSAGAENQTGRAGTEAEEQASTEDERTGEGTGARAGEYS